MNSTERFIANELSHVAPLPLQDNHYPYGFKMQLRSEHGTTKHIQLTPAQLKKIELILLGGE